MPHLLTTSRHLVVYVLLAIIAAAPAVAAPSPATQAATRVALLTYGPPAKTPPCFADKFLAEVARAAHADIDLRLGSVALGSPDVFGYPFVVMTGQNAFKLSDQERRNLHDYLTRGGFILATAGCSSPAWATSFKAAIALAFPEQGRGASGGGGGWAALPMSHPLFHQIYDIDTLRYTQASDQPIVVEGLELDGRLAVVFSAAGLNDTAHVGGQCCCCGLNEVQDAYRLNANILTYALFH